MRAARSSRQAEALEVTPVGETVELEATVVVVIVAVVEVQVAGPVARETVLVVGRDSGALLVSQRSIVGTIVPTTQRTNVVVAVIRAGHFRLFRLR